MLAYHVGETIRTEENKDACPVRYGTWRLTQTSICTFNLHLCYARKLSAITVFPLSSQQHIMKWLPTPFYTHGTDRIHLTPPLPLMLSPSIFAGLLDGGLLVGWRRSWQALLLAQLPSDDPSAPWWLPRCVCVCVHACQWVGSVYRLKFFWPIFCLTYPLHS